jgi:hypothetical protein
MNCELKCAIDEYSMYKKQLGRRKNPVVSDLRVNNDGGDLVNLVADKILRSITSSMAVSRHRSFTPQARSLSSLVVNSKVGVARGVGRLDQNEAVVAVGLSASDCSTW